MFSGWAAGPVLCVGNRALDGCARVLSSRQRDAMGLWHGCAGEIGWRMGGERARIHREIAEDSKGSERRRLIGPSIGIQPRSFGPEVAVAARSTRATASRPLYIDTYVDVCIYVCVCVCVCVCHSWGPGATSLSSAQACHAQSTQVSRPPSCLERDGGEKKEASRKSNGVGDSPSNTVGGSGFNDIK